MKSPTLVCPLARFSLFFNDLFTPLYFQRFSPPRRDTSVPNTPPHASTLVCSVSRPTTIYPGTSVLDTPDTPDSRTRRQSSTPSTPTLACPSTPALASPTTPPESPLLSPVATPPLLSQFLPMKSPTLVCPLARFSLFFNELFTPFYFQRFSPSHPHPDAHPLTPAPTLTPTIALTPSTPAVPHTSVSADTVPESRPTTIYPGTSVLDTPDTPDSRTRRQYAYSTPSTPSTASVSSGFATASVRAPRMPSLPSLPMLPPLPTIPPPPPVPHGTSVHTSVSHAPTLACPTLACSVPRGPRGSYAPRSRIPLIELSDSALLRRYETQLRRLAKRASESNPTLACPTALYPLVLSTLACPASTSLDPPPCPQWLRHH